MGASQGSSSPFEVSNAHLFKDIWSWNGQQLGVTMASARYEPSAFLPVQTSGNPTASRSEALEVVPAQTVVHDTVYIFSKQCQINIYMALFFCDVTKGLHGYPPNCT